MTIRLAVDVRNARMDAILTAIGASPVLKIRTGTPPDGCAAADSGTVLATLALPEAWLETAANGSIAKSGTWQDLLADENGEAGHFRIYASDGTTCKLQGTCSLPAGGGDMRLINTNIAVNQPVSVTTFALTDANS